MAWWSLLRRSTAASRGPTGIGGNVVVVNRTKGDATVVIEAPGPAAPPEPPGHPITEHDPFDLDVHEAIAVPGDLPALPVYVRRGHDAALDERVRETRSGRSAAVLLVGESSTGKTRAAWEAVKDLPEPWTLWYPSDAGELLRGVTAVASHTVLWLDDAQQHLLTPGSVDGERAAAALRALLRDRDRRPVLVLGTIWPRPWQRLTGPPPDSGDDLHAQARRLLVGRALSVPTAFTGRDEQALRALTRRDARLAEAAARAEGGRVAQFLAGAPALVERYLTAPPEIKALIECAVDARRLGFGTVLPRTLLETAALGYLDAAQQDALPVGWADGAFAQVSPPIRGIRGPLSPSMPGPDGPAYTLADYLEQTGRVTRHGRLPPAALWDALHDHAEPEALLRISASASERGLLRTAVRFCLKAMEIDPSAGRLQISRLMSSSGRDLEAAEWAAAAAEAGEPGARARRLSLVWDAASRLNCTSMAAQADADYWLGFGHDENEEHLAVYEAAGGDTALEEAQRARRAGESFTEDVEDSDDDPPPERAYPSLRAAGSRFLDLLRSGKGGAGAAVAGLIEPGDIDADLPGSWTQAGVSQWESGRKGLGLDLIRHGADLGDFHAIDHAKGLLSGDSFLSWLREVADGGNIQGAGRLAAALTREGSDDEALEWWLVALERGYPEVLIRVRGLLARVAAEEGGEDKIVDWYQKAAALGADDAAGIAADLLRAGGRFAEAALWYRKAIESGDRDSVEDLARLVADTGEGGAEADWLRDRAKAGDSAAAAGVALIHWSSGEREEALLWLQDRGAAGDVEALRTAVDLLAGDAREEEAMALFRRVVETTASRRAVRPAKAPTAVPGRPLPEIDARSPLFEARRILREMGSAGEAKRLYRYGWDTDGGIAESWEAHPPPPVRPARSEP
ncbi:hypothetical protein EDD29_3500 [Actinocorallia herbida]|uniref:TPR repeat protein n=1 Tax=Actinocorallia herbida TaxID=58109 RepID=A0A3N1CXH3_9ACTN|nr:ATP-binding protein [Actinocorallia herbida]ROO85946.1 hypothetical protein EDD29_3500 [Actinocorallia herbida]